MNQHLNEDQVKILKEILTDHKQTELLETIEATFAKINLNQYGHCEICAGPIAFERLIALPTTRRCLQCKQNLEQEQLAAACDKKTSHSINSKVRKGLLEYLSKF